MFLHIRHLDSADDFDDVGLPVVGFFDELKEKNAGVREEVLDVRHGKRAFGEFETKLLPRTFSAFLFMVCFPVSIQSMWK